MQERLTYFGKREAVPGPVIPSQGAATTAYDQYRTLGVLENNLPELRTAFTDMSSASAIAKIGEGGLESYSDLLAAECALQALLLHDSVHLITYGPRITQHSGLSTYLRETDSLSPLSREIFALARSRDWIICPEHVEFHEDRRVEATAKKSLYSNQERIEHNEYWSEYVEMAIVTAIQEHEIPAYISDKRMSRPYKAGDFGFAKKFYHKVGESWNKSTASVPPINININLPPLLAIVLDRMNSRDEIVSVISSLREELADARIEIAKLDQIPFSVRSAAEVESASRYYTEAFEAVVRESRLSNAERRQRRLLSIQDLIRPLVRFGVGFVKATAQDHSWVNDFMNYSDAPPRSVSRVVNRSITARQFANMLNTESLAALMRMHFSDQELRAIHASTI